MQVRLIGKYLRRWGFTPQRPIKEAIEQEAGKVERWLKEQYPAVLTRTKAQGGKILWGDETAVREDTAWGRNCAPHGQTPVLKTAARWEQLSMSSARSVRGELLLEIVDGSISAERFIPFLQAVVEDADREVFLVVDNGLHHATKVTECLKGKEQQIELVVLPPYAPESNPNEYLNGDFTPALRSAAVSRSKDEFLEKAMGSMKRLATMSQQVMAYRRYPAVAVCVEFGLTLGQACREHLDAGTAFDDDAEHDKMEPYCLDQDRLSMRR